MRLGETQEDFSETIVKSKCFLPDRLIMLILHVLSFVAKWSTYFMANRFPHRYPDRIMDSASVGLRRKK